MQGRGPLIAESEIDAANRQGYKTAEELDYQFDLFFFLTLSYVFELLFLRLQARHIFHHFCVIAATYAYFRRRHSDSHHARNDLYQVPALMATYGMGLFDIGLDGIRLLYYGTFPSKATTPRALIRGSVCLHDRYKYPA